MHAKMPPFAMRKAAFYKALDYQRVANEQKQKPAEAACCASAGRVSMRLIVVNLCYLAVKRHLEVEVRVVKVNEIIRLAVSSLNVVAVVDTVV